MQVRLPVGTTLAGAAVYAERLGLILSADTPLRYSDWSAVSCSYISQDTGLAIPMSIPTIAPGFESVPSNPGWQRAVYLRFEARGADGSKTNITLLGTARTLETAWSRDLVLLPGEAGYPALTLTALSELGNQFVTGSGHQAIWYPKVNTGINKKWARRVRGG
jgi:hypothetical protein